jgi:hypothetical protein
LSQKPFLSLPLNPLPFLNPHLSQLLLLSQNLPLNQWLFQSQSRLQK